MVSENNFDTENKTGYGPILATVIVGVAILLGDIICKKKQVIKGVSDFFVGYVF